MVSRLFVFACLLGWLVVSISAEQSQEPFHFKAPGWVEIQPDVHINKIAETRSGRISFVAIDPRDRGETKVTAIVGEGRLEMSRAFLEKYAANLNAYAPKVRELSMRTGGGEVSLPKVTADDLRIVDFNGVPVGRVVSESVVDNIKKKSVAYYMPGKDSFAVVTFLTSPSHFEKRQAEFDQIARNTEGVAIPNPAISFWESISGRIVMGCIVGALYGAFEFYRRKEKGASVART